MSFKIEAFQNRHVSIDQSRIDAILTVAAEREAAPTGAAKLLLGFIIDCSGSMNGERIASAKRAVARALQLLEEPASFFIVAFNASGKLVVGAAPATRENKQVADQAMAHLGATGGTAMSTGLAAARAVFEKSPDRICQAVFLTDGKNESEKPAEVEQELTRCEGRFACDCWGVGTDWKVGEVQRIARTLLGKASLIPEAAGIDAAFSAAMEKASTKSLKDVRLRLWTPMGSRVLFLKQVNPTIEDLSARARELSPQVREYLTGAWARGESRDFHVAVEVKPGRVGDEMLAARPSVVYLESGAGGWTEKEVKPAEARLLATWTGNDALSSRIDPQVAHYTGQGELAEAIQKGLEMRERGDLAAATQLLGRAVQLAHASANAEITHRLGKVVEVVDATRGTIKLKRQVAKAAAMELELESTTTRRAQKLDHGTGG